MSEKLFKSLFIKIAAGAIVLFVILFGLFLLGRKPPQSSIPNTETWVARKIPKSNSMVEPFIKQNPAKIPSSENVPETTIEQKIPEPDETLLNSENPLEPEKGDKTDSISIEETPEETKIAKPINVNETDAFSKIDGKIGEEEPAEETGLRISEEAEAEKPVVKEEPETETVSIEKESSFSEHKEKRIFRGIVLSGSGSEQKLVFQADNPIIKYKYFFLSNPPRLVVDLPGVWKDPDFFEKKVDSSLISRIRLWNHGDKLRIVNDLKSDKTLFPVFTKSSDGVEVVLKTR